MNEEKSFCKDCKFYTGIHDWDLSCTNPSDERRSWCGVLVYGYSIACENFLDIYMIIPIN